MNPIDRGKLESRIKKLSFEQNVEGEWEFRDGDWRQKRETLLDPEQMLEAIRSGSLDAEAVRCEHCEGIGVMCWCSDQKLGCFKACHITHPEENKSCPVCGGSGRIVRVEKS